jgi:hypothetical protein
LTLRCAFAAATYLFVFPPPSFVLVLSSLSILCFYHIEP